jgi:hypothetical protein
MNALTGEAKAFVALLHQYRRDVTGLETLGDIRCHFGIL